MVGMFDNVEQAENFEQKCLCVLVLDVSGSMSGQPIDELNKGLQAFYSDVSDDDALAPKLEVGIIEFSSTATCLQEPALLDNFSMPTLHTKGSTALVDGVRMGIDMIKQRKEYWKGAGVKYYRPWLVLITDGAPDAGQDISGLAQQIQDSKASKAFQFLAVGVQGADMGVLKNIAGGEEGTASLKELNFAQFFTWLSASMGIISASQEGQKINLPAPTDWMSGYQP